MFIVLAIIGIVSCIVSGALLVGSYKKVMKLQEASNRTWGVLSIELKRCLDHAPSLIIYAHHLNISKPEEIHHLFELRMAVVTTQAVWTQSSAQREFRNELKPFLQVLKNNPQLRFNSSFQELYEKYKVMDDEFMVAVRTYNAVARSYNTYMYSFPGSLVARFCQLQHRSYFDLHGTL